MEYSINVRSFKRHFGLYISACINASMVCFRLQAALEDIEARLLSLQEMSSQWSRLQLQTEKQQAWLDSQHHFCQQLAHSTVADTEAALKQCDVSFRENKKPNS